MPSHFHSTMPVVGRRALGSSDSVSSGDARKNGYGRERSIVRALRREQRRYHSAVGVHSPISRAAIVGGRKPAACASARTTQRLRDADAELARQQLEQDEPLPAIERAATSR